jgi:septal ring factor EnvC (AmiA/AmiB activator)
MPNGNLLPGRRMGRGLRDHKRVIATIGALALVAILVAFSVSRESALHQAKANLASAQRALTTSQGALATSQGALTTSRGALATSKQTLTTTQQALTTSNASLASTQATLATTQSTLTATQSQLKAVTAGAAQAQTDLASLHGQLTTAQASSAACQAFVSDADSLVGLQNQFISVNTDAWQALNDGVDATPYINQESSIISELTTADARYKIDKTACFGG